MITIKGLQYYTPEEYSLHIQKSLKTVYNRIKDGKVETKKILDKTFIKA